MYVCEFKKLYIVSGQNVLSNIESNEPAKIAYPKRVILILGTEFCERFSFFGMTSKLNFS